MSASTLYATQSTTHIRTYLHAFDTFSLPTHPHDAKHLPTISKASYNNYCWDTKQPVVLKVQRALPVLKAAPVSVNCSMLQSLVLRTIECSASWPARAPSVRSGKACTLCRSKRVGGGQLFQHWTSQLYPRPPGE